MDLGDILRREFSVCRHGFLLVVVRCVIHWLVPTTGGERSVKITLDSGENGFVVDIVRIVITSCIHEHELRSFEKGDSANLPGVVSPTLYTSCFKLLLQVRL